MLTLELLRDSFTYCRLDAKASIPQWALAGEFFSITRTADELSLVCATSLVSSDVQAEGGWRCLKVVGPLDFALTGIIAGLTAPLAAAGISVSVIATYDTDYLLVKANTLAKAIAALQSVGYRVNQAETA